jgi:hypothetical protein
VLVKSSHWTHFVSFFLGTAVLCCLLFHVTQFSTHWKWEQKPAAVASSGWQRSGCLYHFVSRIAEKRREKSYTNSPLCQWQMPPGLLLCQPYYQLNTFQNILYSPFECLDKIMS